MRFLVLVPFLISLCLSSQDLDLKGELDKPSYLSPRIGFSLSGLINPYSRAAALTAEYPFSYVLRLESELGYIFNSSIFNEYKGEFHRGFRFRGAMKIYFQGSTYAKITYKYHRLASKTFYEGVRQGDGFREWRLEERAFNVNGGMFSIGFDFPMRSKHNNWILDLSIGLGGIYFRTKEDLDLPLDFELTDRFAYSILGKEHFGADFAISMQIEHVFQSN